ncbi:MAG: hypothetical protein AAB875_02690, partial [Patescibacteria group bacterium]
DARRPRLTASPYYPRGVEAGLLGGEPRRRQAGRIEVQVAAEEDEQMHVMAARSGYRLDWRRPPGQDEILEAVFTLA